MGVCSPPQDNGSNSRATASEDREPQSAQPLSRQSEREGDGRGGRGEGGGGGGIRRQRDSESSTPRSTTQSKGTRLIELHNTHIIYFSKPMRLTNFLTFLSNP